MDHCQGALRFVLRPIAPFRLDLTVWALRRRARNLIDRWDGTTFRRVLVIEGQPTELSVRQRGSSAAPRLAVTVTPAPQTLLGKRYVRSVLNLLLGLRIDLTDWYQTAAGDARLRPLAEAFRGMKPPRFPTMFETVVNALACQQLSLEAGLELLNRLATSTGPLRFPHAVRHGTATAQEVPSDWIQLSESPRASRPRPRNRATGTGLGVTSGGRRCSGATAFARVARCRSVDVRIRAAARPRTPTGVPWR
jgi:hypothetical protein